MSIRHWPKRACTQTFLAWLLPSVALAAVADAVPDSITPAQMFGILAACVVVIMAALTATLSRWLRNAGESVARTRGDIPSLARIEAGLGLLRHDFRRVEQQVGEARGDIADTRDRVSQMEGTLRTLPCMRSVPCPPGSGR